MYEASDPEKEGHEYGKSIFDSESETGSNIDDSHKVNQKFEIDSVKYQCDEKHVDDLSLHNTLVHSENHDPLKYKLDLAKIKQLQGKDMHLSKIITKCKSQHCHNKTPYYLDEHGIAYRKILR